MTVVVDAGETLFVGRCDEVTDQGVVLLDVDVHDGDEPEARRRYLERAAQIGVWAQQKVLVVPAERVVSIRRLTDVVPD